MKSKKLSDPWLKIRSMIRTVSFVIRCTVSICMDEVFIEGFVFVFSKGLYECAEQDEVQPYTSLSLPCICIQHKDPIIATWSALVWG